MKLQPNRIAEARGDMSRPELARRLSRRDPYHLGTTSAQQIKRWEQGHHRMRFESETIAAIAAETGRDVAFFYAPADEQAASDDGEAAPVAGIQLTATDVASAMVIAFRSLGLIPDTKTAEAA